MFTHVESPELPELKQVTAPNGKRVYVTPEGNSYPSVTTILGSQDKTHLDEWRNRIGKKEADGITKQAADRGSIIHDTLEKYLGNDPDYLKGLMPVDKMSIKELKPVLSRINNIRHLETRLYSNRLRIAGTVDCVAEFDGVLSIIDFKTSRRTKLEEWITDYFMQESAYAACYLELTGVAIKQIVTLISVTGGQPQVFIKKPAQYLQKFIELRNAFDG